MTYNDINAVNDKGESVLYSLGKNYPMVEYLLELGADPLRGAKAQSICCILLVSSSLTSLAILFNMFINFASPDYEHLFRLTKELVAKGNCS